MSLLPQIEEQKRRVKGLEETVGEVRTELEILEKKLQVERDYLQVLVSDEQRVQKERVPS